MILIKVSAINKMFMRYINTIKIVFILVYTRDTRQAKTK